MTDKELQARKRLAKKLTALRKTLRKDERDVLDHLVAKTGAEVEGHVLVQAASSEVFELVSGCYSVYESVM